MGLLNFLPDDPNKKEAMRAGLLNLGAAMLQGRGNFGSVLGQGIGAGAQGYQGALADQQKAMLDTEQAKRWKLENEQTQAAIAEPGERARILAGGLPPASQALSAPQALIGAPQGANVAPVSALPTMGAQTAPAQPAKPKGYSADDYRAMGDRLSASGRMDAAKPYYDQADKMKPKLKEQRALMVEGKRVLVNVYDDGRTELVDGFAPDAEKLNFGSTGGAYEGRDPFSGKVVSSTPMTQSPDSRASNATQQRGQNMTDARAREARNDSFSKPFEATGPDGTPVLVRQDKQGNISPVDGYAPKRALQKPVPPGVVKTLTEARDNAATMDRLNTAFKPAYGGKGVFGLGADMSMAVKGNVGADQESVAFWKDYRKQAELVERHAMFGASLTPGEQQSWRSADIAPGMHPDVIKKNLATRAALSKRIAAATADDMVDAGHNEGRVRAIAGRGEEKPAAGPYSDAEKERRYQAWKKSQGQK